MQAFQKFCPFPRLCRPPCPFCCIPLFISPSPLFRPVLFLCLSSPVRPCKALSAFCFPLYICSPHFRLMKFLCLSFRLPPVLSRCVPLSFFPRPSLQSTLSAVLFAVVYSLSTPSNFPLSTLPHTFPLHIFQRIPLRALSQTQFRPPPRRQIVSLLLKYFPFFGLRIPFF